MASYTWPSALPTSVDSQAYSEVSGALVLVSPMDAGPAKMRYRGQKPRQFTVDMIMDDSQIATLEAFINTTLRGTARFDFPHPRTQTIIEARFIPSSDGKYFGISYFAPYLYRISFSLEQMP
jgi:hypothetical protein